MTRYGSIPTTTTVPLSSDLEFVSLAKDRIKTSLGTRQPWTDMFQVSAFNLPASIGQALRRIGTNIMFYRMNYVIVMLFILFLCLLWQPTSLIFFIIVMVAWLFLYFLRDDPLIVYGHEINDRMVTLILSVVTILGLIVTDAKDNIAVSLFSGAVAVVVHATFREGEAMAVEDDEGVRSGGPVTLPLKHAASSSYSLP